jgi:hypothetical protein
MILPGAPEKYSEAERAKAEAKRAKVVAIAK